MHFDRLDDLGNKYCNPYHRTSKMKPVDIRPSIHFDFNKKTISKINVTISKQKSIFVNGYVLNWSEEVFVIIKVINTLLRRNVISDLNGEEIF